MTLSQRNLAIYGLLGLILVVAQWANSAIASGEVDWFASYPAVQYKGLALAILGYVIPVLTLGAAAYRTRIGSEGVGAQVNDLRADGVPRDEMVVLQQDDAALALGLKGTAGALSPSQIQQMVAAVKAEMVRDPEGNDPISVPDHVIGLLDRDERTGGRG